MPLPGCSQQLLLSPKYTGSPQESMSQELQMVQVIKHHSTTLMHCIPWTHTSQSGDSHLSNFEDAENEAWKDLQWHHRDNPSRWYKVKLPGLHCEPQMQALPKNVLCSQSWLRCYKPNLLTVCTLLQQILGMVLLSVSAMQQNDYIPR